MWVNTRIRSASESGSNPAMSAGAPSNQPKRAQAQEFRSQTETRYGDMHSKGNSPLRSPNPEPSSSERCELRCTLHSWITYYLPPLLPSCVRKASRTPRENPRIGPSLKAKLHPRLQLSATRSIRKMLGRLRPRVKSLTTPPALYGGLRAVIRL